MPRLGFPELAIILVIALIIFGPGKLPGLGKSVGETIKEFRKGTSEPVSVNKTEISETVQTETKADVKGQAINAEGKSKENKT
ncbi:twin-arginine translocase TatA/TatE family subunit [Acetobacterium sp.]|uniref:twin-arginine translocase TatA/TatE family subunit n=1 Tax=Acetobacterium sp. TaxID=1872094 RepID=UPI002F403CA6